MKPQTKDYFLVSIQFVLFIIYSFPMGKNYSLLGWIHIVGFCASILGILMIVYAIWQMKYAITAYPTPKEKATLIDSGIFKYWRHPIYAGVIYAAFGFSLFWGSIFKFLISVLLLILFHFKTKYEEERLDEKYENYNEYKKKTGYLFPKINRSI
jgi:protein-S-isoprenylcysteine O-methyltransferase Ste14